MSEYRGLHMLEALFMEEAEDDNAPTDKETPVEEKETAQKEDNNASTDEKESDNVGDDEDVDLSEFGQHGGDDLPNNEYDQKEVETLNKLIASEASAISEYAEAAKTSHEDILQRLYSDISDEERFHLEQLMFAKAELTGEKYMPTDPAVKREYEELLELGMDEEDAMATAIDKTGLRKQIEEADGDIEQDTQKLEADIEMLEAAVYNTELLIAIMEQAEDQRDEKILNQIQVFTESFYQEAIMNTADASDEMRKPFNPFVALYKLITGIMTVISNLIVTFKNWMIAMKQKRQASRSWIQNHGIQGLFERGVHMYLWDDSKQEFSFQQMAWFIDGLYLIARECGNDAFKPNGHIIDQQLYDKYMKPFNDDLPLALDSNSIGLTRETVLDRLNSLNMMKTKIIVNKQNENKLMELFFGYTEIAMIKFNPESKQQVQLKSQNVYNSIQYILDICNYYGKMTGELIKGFQTIGEGSSNRNTIFYTNRNQYNEDYRQLKLVVKGYSTFSNCMTHDLRVIMYINNGTLERTNQLDSENNDTAHRYSDPNQKRMFVHKSDGEKQADATTYNSWKRNHDIDNALHNAPTVNANGTTQNGMKAKLDDGRVVTLTQRFTDDNGQLWGKYKTDDGQTGLVRLRS